MESIKELRKICQQPEAPLHPIYRFWEIFSIYLTKIFLIIGLKPNFITGLSFLSGILGGCFYLIGQFLLGSIFFIAFYLLDAVDGEVARYRKSTSKFGAWLDITCGHLLYPYFFFTLGLGVFFQTGILWYFLLGTLGAIAKLIERSVPRVSSVGNNSVKAASFSGGAKEWLSFIGKFSVLFPAILFCSIMGWENWFLWFFAIYLLLFALAKVFLTGWRIYRYNH